VVKKRTPARAASRKNVKASRKGAKKKAAPRRSLSSPVVSPGAAYQTKEGIDLRPLKMAIRLTIERLSKAKESPKVASALESLITVQQRLSADCNPTMTFPSS
jgi:hypothetical protein